MSRAARIIVVVLGYVLATVEPAHADHVAATYKVFVRVSDGTTFTDCLHFDDPAIGRLTVDGLGTLTYRHGGLDSAHNRFKAVTRGPGFETMLFGTFRSNLRQLQGEALDELGATYVFTGRRNASCSFSSTSVPLGKSWAAARTHVE